jgi:predicted Zn finger-like uncharacterized protein
MLIVCPNCASTYSLTAEQLGRGRTLRCAQCRHTWFAEASSAAPEPAPAEPEPPLQAAPETEAPPPPASPARRARPPAKAKAKRGLPAMSATSLGTALRPMLRPANLVAVLLAAVLVVGVAQRRKVVQLLPQTARLFAAIGLPVNLRGVAFADVRSGLVIDKDQTALVVEGEIRNVTRAPVQVASLSLDLRGKEGQTLYSWTAEPPKPVLEPGEAVPFRSRLVSPPADGHDIVVRFAADAAVAQSH